MKVLIFMFLSLSVNLLSGQVLNGDGKLTGMPEVVHYSRTDFKGDPQFWAVCEGQDGVMYFGNNDGALIFDGERWQKVNLPNYSSIRSLVAANGKIYAGGYNELGLIKRNEYGRYYYESLMEALNLENSDFENLWQAHTLNGKVIFRSFDQLIVVSGQNAVSIPASNSFIYSHVANGKYYVEDANEGLMHLNLEDRQLFTAFETWQYNNEDIASMLPAGREDRLFAFAKSGKVYLLDTKEGKAKLGFNIFSETDKDQVLCAIKGSNGLYYIGTLSSRVLIMDETGSIDTENTSFSNLKDKTILNLYEEKSGNVWALLNNGLDFINFNSASTILFDRASVYDVLIDSEKLYVATNQGVFFTEPDNSNYLVNPLDFEKLGGIEGQAWTIDNFDNSILVGHDKGLFEIEEEKATKIGNLDGFWKVIPMEDHEDKYLACHYEGLYLLEKIGGTWQISGKIEGFKESSRDILPADEANTYWVCHGYKGVYRITLNEDLSRVSSIEHFSDQAGLPSPFNINVFRWKGEVVFTTNAGVYIFDDASDSFRPHQRLNSILNPEINNRKILEQHGKTWFVEDDELGYFQSSEETPDLHKDLFQELKGTFNRGMECILPLDTHRLLVGTNIGLFLFDMNEDRRQKQAQTLITGASFIKNKEEQDIPLTDQSSSFNLPQGTSILRIEFASPQMNKATDVLYSYKLEGTDENWSPWQLQPAKEYTHLRPGDYEFKVRSRNLTGMSATEASYSFSIPPFWYQSTWAWIAYAFLAGALFWIAYHLISKKIEKENLKVQQREQRATKLLELEVEQLRLKAEKEEIKQDKLMLQEDVVAKSKELANYTMQLVKKKDILAELQEDLKELRSSAKNETSRKKILSMFQKLNRHSIGEEYLQVFDVNFERIHHRFFNSLKEYCPELTTRELRLCAFIKMDLTNKEIAPLLNISVRGVETARYRLRKKLNLKHEHNLVEFLESIGEEKIVH